MRTFFHCCLVHIMVVCGRARPVWTRRGGSPICVSEAIAGDTFSLAKPAISREEERDIIASLRQILTEEGGL
jgi:hypothetical protein